MSQATLTAPRRPAGTVRGARVSRRVVRSWRREQTAIGVISASVYAAVAVYLVVGRNSIAVDSMARLANGSFVFFGRDPHLGAVGFVWNPLPSLAVAPLLLLHSLFPVLLVRALAGNIVTAVVMGLVVVVFAGTARDLGLGRSIRVPVTVAFALTPMILYYGANGMSEAYLLLAQALVVRHVIRWTRTGSGRALMVTGAALGLGYGARYESAPIAVAVTVLVAVVTWVRAGHDPRAVLLDATVVGLPFGFAFVAWALTSWLLVGAPFEQFTSSYGNSEQLIESGANAVGNPPWSLGRLLHSGSQMLYLEPLVPVAVVALIAAALLRRRLEFIVPLMALGPVLGFEILAWFSGSTFGWWRFYIDTIPLVATSLLLFASPDLRRRDRGLTSPNRADGGAKGKTRRIGVATIMVLVLMCGYATQTVALSKPATAPEEYRQLAPVIRPDSAVGMTLGYRFEVEQKIAARLDAMDLPDGSVLVDATNGFAIVIASRRPSQFVITPDRDFKQQLAGLGHNGVRYVLDVPDAALGRSNAVNVRFPSFYRDGAGLGTLSAAFPATSDQPDWRLWRIRTHAG